MNKTHTHIHTNIHTQSHVNQNLIIIYGANNNKLVVRAIVGSITAKVRHERSKLEARNKIVHHN